MNIVFMSMDTLPSTLWARDLYDQMHIRSDFRKWFPRMCQYGFIEGCDYEYMPRVRLQDEGGRTVQRYVKDYRITQDMAKKLCKLHHTAVGAAYHPQPFDWDALLGLLHKKPPRRSSYEAQLSDSESLVTTTQIAKEYGCGAKVFNRLLHLHGIQYRVNGQWVLYSEHHGKGYTSSLTFRLQRSDGSEVEKLHTASYLNILAPELTDKVLAEFLDMDKNLVVSIHVQSVDQLKAIKLIKGKITDLDRMKIEEQKKAVRSGYDMEIIPSDLATYGGEAKKILDDLQSRNERMFLVTVLFLNTAKTKQELDSAVFQTAGIAQKFNCTLNRLDYLQEQGLMSNLPLANNLVPIKRALTTTSTAIFVPFTTQELFMEGDSLYYGLNAVSNNMIMADRKQLKNPNGLILGTPGSGKSFSAKREITNVFFTTTDDIIVADPEGEYYPLVEALGGQVIHISSTSKDYINPMDINLNYADDDNPLGMKSDFILSLCELIMGARDGMEPEEKSVIDRCLPLVYQKYLNDPKPENMPTLGDLYDCLREQKERQAQRIATALEIYVNGSLRVFNHQTNVELDNRIICFDIKELGKQLKKLGMLIVQDQVWNRVTINRNSKKNTRYYIDEFHLLLKEEQTAAYSVEIWKRFRKWGGVPTGITQNIKVRPDRALCKVA